MSDNGSDIGAFMAGFVIGGLVGAATALILAPQSGEETRSQIAARGAEIRMVGEERLGEYRSLASDKVNEARTRVQDSTANVQEQARIVLDEGKTKFNTAVEKGKQQVEGLTNNDQEEG